MFAKIAMLVPQRLSQAVGRPLWRALTRPLRPSTISAVRKRSLRGKPRETEVNKAKLRPNVLSNMLGKGSKEIGVRDKVQNTSIEGVQEIVLNPEEDRDTHRRALTVTVKLWTGFIGPQHLVAGSRI